MTNIKTAETFRVMAEALSPGDDVMVHASVGLLGHFEQGIESIVDALFAAVGPEGTIVMMTATRSFAKTGRFDIGQPSEIGILTETFRKWPGVRRSIVPMVSFAAKGARANDYLQTYHSFLDATAPLTRLLENDGLILLLGVPYQKCTLWHLSEERHTTPANLYKTFKGVLVDGERVVAPISQRYYVRRDLKLQKDISIVGKMLEERHLVTALPLGDGILRAFRARDFDACCMEALSKNPLAFTNPDRN